MECYVQSLFQNLFIVYASDSKFVYKFTIQCSSLAIGKYFSDAPNIHLTTFSYTAWRLKSLQLSVISLFFADHVQQSTKLPPASSFDHVLEVLNTAILGGLYYPLAMRQICHRHHFCLLFFAFWLLFHFFEYCLSMHFYPQSCHKTHILINI